ncbi:MAG: hypothetical protein M3N68_14205 [Actinomycetota bacterium]|nr:hypothetical protein [Actinomycetota bacterium]
MTSGRSHFHNRILSLQRAVLAVGREVQRSIADATDAWLRRDCVAGEAVNARTAGWSARARDIELAVYALLATQQPMASDLRRLTALVRLTEEVARSGDLVAHVARSACFERAADDFTPPLRALLVEMATVAASLFGDALPPSKRGRRGRRGGGRCRCGARSAPPGAVRGVARGGGRHRPGHRLRPAGTLLRAPR